MDPPDRDFNKGSSGRLIRRGRTFLDNSISSVIDFTAAASLLMWRTSQTAAGSGGPQIGGSIDSQLLTGGLLFEPRWQMTLFGNATYVEVFSPRSQVSSVVRRQSLSPLFIVSPLTKPSVTIDSKLILCLIAPQCTSMNSVNTANPVKSTRHCHPLLASTSTDKLSRRRRVSGRRIATITT